VIEKNRVSIIQDNFLPAEQFAELKANICSPPFDWHWTPIIAYDNEETYLAQPSPGFFIHIVHENNMPFDPKYYNLFASILNHLNPEYAQNQDQPGTAAVIIGRIRCNLNHRLPEPYKYMYHSDLECLEDRVAAEWTTSILYINTNNGYTELETGEKIESVENRLVSFPANIEHRGVTQTDEQTRIVVNFNYLKMTEAGQEARRKGQVGEEQYKSRRNREGKEV